MDPDGKTSATDFLALKDVYQIREIDAHPLRVAEDNPWGVVSAGNSIAARAAMVCHGGRSGGLVQEPWKSRDVDRDECSQSSPPERCGISGFKAGIVIWSNGPTDCD